MVKNMQITERIDTAERQIGLYHDLRNHDTNINGL